MDITIYLRGEHGGVHKLAGIPLEDDVARQLRDDFLNYHRGGNPKAGAYDAKDGSGKPFMLLIRFDEVILIR